MNIYLPAILGFTRCQGFDPSPGDEPWKIRDLTHEGWKCVAKLVSKNSNTCWADGKHLKLIVMGGNSSKKHIKTQHNRGAAPCGKYEAHFEWSCKMVCTPKLQVVSKIYFMLLFGMMTLTWPMCFSSLVTSGLINEGTFYGHPKMHKTLALRPCAVKAHFPWQHPHPGGV